MATKQAQAVSVGRRQMAGVWVYTVTVVSEQTSYEVDVSDSAACRRFPFCARRLGRAPRRLGYGSAVLKERLFSVALDALSPLAEVDP